MFRLRLATSAFDAMSAARCYARLAPPSSAGTPDTRPARNSPRDRPAARAAEANRAASSAVSRTDSLTTAEHLPRSTSRSPGSAASGTPRSRAIAARTSAETLTRSACARATSAAFRPRKSTVTKSWAVVFMSRRMEESEALVKLAAGRQSLHSPTHSVSARIEVTGPMISTEESSNRLLWPAGMHREADDKTTGAVVDLPTRRRSAAGCGSSHLPLITKHRGDDGEATDPAEAADEVPPQSR